MKEENLFGHNIYKPLLERIFFKPFSKRIAQSLAKTSISPNQVTCFSFFLFVCAAFMVTQKRPEAFMLSAILIYFSFLFDKVDGDLARLTNRASAKGQYLDSFFDVMGELIFAIALATSIGFQSIPLISLSVAAPILFYYHHLMVPMYLGLAPSTYRQAPATSSLKQFLKGVFSYNRVKHMLFLVVILLLHVPVLYFYLMPLMILYTIGLFLKYATRRNI